MIELWNYDLVPDTKIKTRKLTAKRTINAADTYVAQNGKESPLLVQLDSMGQFGFAEVFGKESVFQHAEKMYEKGEKVFEESGEILSESKDILDRAESLKKEYQPLINDAAKYISIKSDCIYKNKKYPKDKLFDYKTGTRFDENGKPLYKVIFSGPSALGSVVVRTKNNNGSYIEARGDKSGIRTIEKSRNSSGKRKSDFEERFTFWPNGELERYEEDYSNKHNNEGNIPEKTETTAKVFSYIDNKLNTFIAGKEIKDIKYAIDVNSKGVYLFDYSRDGNLISAKIGQNNDSIKEEYSFKDGKPREIRLKRDGNRYDKIITYNEDGSIDKIQEECKMVLA